MELIKLAKGLVAVVCLSMISCFFSQHVCSASTEVPRDDHEIANYYEFLFADLVLHGDVTEVITELVPLGELQDKLPPGFSDRYAKITKVTISIRSVMKGHHSSQKLTFVFRSWVEIPSQLKRDTNVVVGLLWNNNILGGIYEIISLAGLCIYDGEHLVSQRAAENGQDITLADLRAKIDSMNIKNLSKNADAIGLHLVNKRSLLH